MTNGFVGEFLILFGAWQASKLYAGLAVLGVVLGAADMLWMVKKVFFGEEGDIVKSHPDMKDMNSRELLTIAPLIVLVFWMGLFPGFFLKYSERSIAHLVENKEQYQITVQAPQQENKTKIGDSREF